MAGSSLEGSPAGRSEVDAALRALNDCVDRIWKLTSRVDAIVGRRLAPAPPRHAMPPATPRQAMSRVIFGGGPSAFTRREPDLPTAPATAAPSSKPPGVRSTGHLIVAADLALGGCSKEQIGQRLQAVSPDVIEDAFE